MCVTYGLFIELKFSLALGKNRWQENNTAELKGQIVISSGPAVKIKRFLLNQVYQPLRRKQTTAKQRK